MGRLLLSLIAAVGAACAPQANDPHAVAAERAPAVQACAIALLPHRGDAPVDRRIRDYQQELDAARAPEGARELAWMERLGWAYVSAARTHHDEGLLLLAEHASACLEQHAGDRYALAAKLLLGHVRHQQHRFAEATAIARELVAARGAWADHALLGDARLEVGDLAQATEAYQRVADLRPGPQAYQRAGELRWALGDVQGARAMYERAVRSLRMTDPGALATVAVRLAELQWQLGESAAAQRTLDFIDGAIADYAPAQYLRGRLLLRQGQLPEAMNSLRAATLSTGLPAHRWAYIEALDLAGRTEEAEQQEEMLLGGAEDPRSRALYLATRGGNPRQALALVREELAARRDARTLSAAAFVALQVGDHGQATRYAADAIGAGTQDGRLCLHLALVDEQQGERDRLADHVVCLRTYEHTLLPSERTLFDQLLSRIALARQQLEAGRRSRLQG